MRIKKWMTLVVAFAMAFTVIGFGLATDDVSAATKAPTKITLKSTYTTVDIKGKVTVSVKSVTPSDASKSVTWKSSNTKIATVNSKGVVTGKKAGKVTITATSKVNKRTAKITITVKQLKPTKLSFPNGTYVVYSGVSKSVKASMPSNIYNAGVVYKCNTSLATITRNGKSINGKATTGSITIKNKPLNYSSRYFTLTAYSKENPKVKTTCRVYVRKSITGLKFDEKVVEVEAGKTCTQKASKNPTKPAAYSKLYPEYRSHNTSVATVDKKTGKVTAVKAGTATIEAKPNDGYQAKATYKVIVYDVLEHDNGVYNIGKDAGYSKYEISAVRNGATESVVLSNEDIANIVGDGNLDMDWM
ncbi:MAG: Ig-like domain-containing protein, partial [Lentihominibacter sp.]